MDLIVQDVLYSGPTTRVLAVVSSAMGTPLALKLPRDKRGALLFRSFSFLEFALELNIFSANARNVNRNVNCVLTRARNSSCSNGLVR